jgi:hypothetical protein
VWVGRCSEGPKTSHKAHAPVTSEGFKMGPTRRSWQVIGLGRESGEKYVSGLINRAKKNSSPRSFRSIDVL